MEKSLYHSTLKTMQEAGASPEYCHGWASGAIGNTALEEQRVTDDYEAGYADGKSGEVNGYKNWIKS